MINYLSPKLRLIFRRVAPFTVTWGLFSALYVILERGIVGDQDYYPATGNVYSFEISIVTVTLGGIMLGTILGFIEVFLIKYWIKSRYFIIRLLLKIIFYLVWIVAFVITITFIVNSTKMGLPAFSEEVLASIVNFVTNFAFVSVIIYAGSIIGITIFISELIENLGTKVVFGFFLGRYFYPRKEIRIFMFLDMRSSTTHAERLGNETYFDLLQRYYEDLNLAVLESYGEIYQYVGDALIITWNADSRHVYPLDCFFKVSEIIAAHKKEYLDRFGMYPEFKAGIHMGEVMSGKVGVVQKEIVFSGDVVNTAARIQGLCNDKNAEILVSHDFIRNVNLGSKYAASEIGVMELRGRKQQVKLFTIEKL